MSVDLAGRVKEEACQAPRRSPGRHLLRLAGEIVTGLTALTVLTADFAPRLSPGLLRLAGSA